MVRTARALLAVAVSGLCLLLMPSPAAATEPVASVAITLTSMEPQLPKRDDEITVTGRVTNITKQRLNRLEALFWRNQAPILSRVGLAQALASESNDPLGARYTGAFQDLFTAREPSLAPNASVDFRLKVKISDLELSPTDGVYLMGVHILQRGNNVAIGRARIFVPVLAAKPRNSLTLTSLVVLNTRPSLVRKGVLSDDHLAAEVGQNGRLTALLKAAETATTSFAVDPALIEELQTMAGGYQVLDSEGATSAGTGQADATGWLEGFERLQSSHDGYRLLYGSPDIAALVHDGQEKVLGDAANANKLVESTRSLPLLVLPAGGTADAATAKAAAALQPDAIVLADTSAKGTTPLLAGPDQVPIVRFTKAAQGGGPGPDPRDTAIHIRQRVLAESWVEATAARDGLAHGRVRLISTAAQAAEGAPELKAPWLKQRTLSELLKTTPAPWSQKFHYSSGAQASQLTAGQLSSLRRFDSSNDTYADLLVDPTNARAEGSAAVARAASAKWRKHDRARRAFLGPQQAALDEILLDKIQIRSSARVQTVARQGVEFPITIRNTLEADAAHPDARAVKVNLVFNSENRQRLTIKTIKAPQIRAQDSFTGNAAVTAKANGVVPVTAQLMTVSGRPVGRPFGIEVQVTQNGTTGWAIAIAAGIVLVGSTFLRIRQVAKERTTTSSGKPPGASGSDGAAPDELSALSSAPAERLDV
ncbi:MAG TPA: hypothetical protein VHR39_10235 [Propionibacteriaceae bacterium]|nr:hypothetical protein [Propionibacteriaceae bacterium]